jgi:hypothetical protein
MGIGNEETPHKQRESDPTSGANSLVGNQAGNEAGVDVPVLSESYQYIITDEALAGVIEAVRETTTLIGVDIETAGDTEEAQLDPAAGDIRLIQIATGKTLAVIDVFKVSSEGVRRLMRELEGKEVVAHHASFEESWLSTKYGYTPNEPLHDTEVMSRVLVGALRIISASPTATN